MPDTKVIAVLIMLANGIVTAQGLSNNRFFEKGWFEVGKIIQEKQYYRLLTSGFLHVNWIHLGINMYVLFMFASKDEFRWEFNVPGLLIIYLGSLILGNLLSLLIHLKNKEYTAVGASGAVSGVVLSLILIDPLSSFRLVIIPGFHFPAWVFALVFIGYSIIGIKWAKEKVGHAAHLGGALAGVLITLALRPHLLPMRYGLLAAIFVPSIIFLVIYVKRPGLLKKFL